MKQALMLQKQKVANTLFICTSCDAQSPKWTGQCLECGAWGTMEAGRASYGSTEKTVAAEAAPVTGFDEIPSAGVNRASVGIGELDRVFGGGIVPGSVTLLGGEPGIGKSTLSLLLCSALAAKNQRVLYVSGEESASQVKMRADRLRVATTNLFFLGDTSVETIIATIEKQKPVFAVIDSVHTLVSDELPSEAGALNQVRAATAKLVNFAKAQNVPLLLIGHVTKDGHVAGPKTVEHLVDAVFSFEGERSSPLRVLRSLKNRFGSTDEAGLFEMSDAGLKEIKNPSAYLLEERQKNVAGSVISCVIEGTRPILIEVQALVQRTAFGYPTRRASGFDSSRLEMLIAVLSRRGGVDLSQNDVYINVVGGLKIKEPAVDLAVIMAMASAAKNAPLSEGLAVWGEVGLGGEIRSVNSADRRMSEAASLGMSKVITALPRSSKLKKPASLEVMDVKSIKDAVGRLI